MNPIEAKAEPAPDDEVAAPALTPEARRALEEAEARRRLKAATEAAPPEVGGRNGPDPSATATGKGRHHIRLLNAVPNARPT